MSREAYLLRNLANAERLLALIKRAWRGEFEQPDLLGYVNSIFTGVTVCLAATPCRRYRIDADHRVVWACP